MKTPLVTVVALSLVIAGGMSQPRVDAQSAPAAVTPTFEVASVKRNTSGDGRMTMGMSVSGQVTMTNIPLRQLIIRAYQLQNFQLIGGPGWLDSDRFDIIAKGEPNLPPARINLMLQSLLVERFKLVARTEKREMPIYALVLARTDGKLGAGLRPAAIDCAAMMTARGRAGAPPPGAPPPGAPPAGRGPGPGGPVGAGGCGMMMGPASFTGGSQPLAQLAMALSPRTGRIVVDKTGLSGMYDFDLQWTPEPGQGGPTGPPPPGAPPLPPIDPNGPSLFTALQEQLGLKLEPQRGPVDVLVIDRVEQPTED